MTQPVALVLSIVSESIAAWLLVAACGWGNPWRAALAATLGTLVTHWAAWSAILWLMDYLNYGVAVAMVEVAVALVESIAYRWIALLGWKRALSLSCAANGASTGLGLALYILAL